MLDEYFTIFYKRKVETESVTHLPFSMGSAIDFGIQINTYAITGPTGTVITFKIEGSNDSVNWLSIWSVNISTTGIFLDGTITNGVRLCLKYLRVKIEVPSTASWDGEIILNFK